MPSFGLGVFDGEDGGSIANELAKMQKTLNWLLRNLDSLNVRELTADHISAGTIDVDLGINIESGTGGVYIDSTGLEIHNGNFRMYDDGGLTAIINGGTFYGDNFVVTSNIWVGEDIYMNADYGTGQTRSIWFDRNLTDPGDPRLLYTGNLGVPYIMLDGVNDIFMNGQLHEFSDRVATRDWVTDNFEPKTP